jgi:hypothetical protein
VMKEIIKVCSPRSPLRDGLAGQRAVRVGRPGTQPLWIVEDSEQKQTLVTAGAPPARVWTVRELESLPWEGDEPLTLARCTEAFASPPPPDPKPVQSGWTEWPE